MKLSKRYQPKEVEEKIYKRWEDSGLLQAKVNKSKKPFCIIMPPVNANGSLHVGHAVFITLQDIMIRHQRMRGKEVLWLPGVDHAGFETQVVFEKHLKKQGKTRFQYSAQQLYKMIWDFCQENSKLVKHQFKTLGCSCDWSREKFTLDKDIIDVVYQTFERMYRDGLVYRGKRIINWCPNHGTSLSDLEVKHKTVAGKLYYIRYPLVKEKDKYIVVATTRPETMLGDTAVAVNPKDKRYKALIGQTVSLPLIGRTITIIADKRIDTAFGTGAVKITPAHDPLDFEIGEDHQLEIINVINKQGVMTHQAGKIYAGLEEGACRDKILQELKQLNLLEKTEDYRHSLGVCYKCETPIEYLISEQWFLRVKALAEKAITVAQRKKIEFIPAYFKKTYLHWMKNIKDWNISRQIIWGIRMPIWYCKKCGATIVTRGEEPQTCPYCKGTELVREKDTFDTWFSSGQWPFASLIAQKNKRKSKHGIFEETSQDFHYFYPTAVMETGRDILFFWVARMIMLGLYATGKIPFRHVYLHGLVLDKDKQKMSKSKGNVIDPLGVAEIYGSDALRMALVFGTSPGRDIVISEEKIIAQKKFANKIWNATRFILLNNPATIENKTDFSQAIKIISPADQRILKGLQKTIDTVNKDLEQFKFHEAAQTIYHFFWHQFCDDYIEASKKQMDDPKEKENTQRILLYSLLSSLKLIHPFMPFISEEIYQHLPLKNKKKCLMVESWPQFKKKIK